MVRLGNTLITNNAIGLNTTNGGKIETWGDNELSNNTTPGASTGSVAKN